MITKTKAVDADGKKLRILEPIYFYVQYVNEAEFRIQKNVRVGLSGVLAGTRSLNRCHDACLQDPKIYGKGCWHCWLIDERGEYLAQCYVTDLTTNPQTAAKLVEGTYKELRERAVNRLGHAKAIVKECAMKIKTVDNTYAKELRGIGIT